MINNIDFLSPPITLFHLEKRTHTSKMGACLVILLLIICLAYTIFLIYNLIIHQKMTYIFYKKFEYEAGYYVFNSSSIFNFIQIYSSESGGYFDEFDSRYIRAFTTFAHYNLTYNNLYLYDHWVFDICRHNIDDKDLEPSLIENIENFTNSVCIRHYYNSLEKKYYSIEDIRFKSPYLEHGISNMKNIYLTTIIQKCSNDSIITELFGKCPPQEEIDNYFNKYSSIYFYFSDNQIDPTNFENPKSKYLQVVNTKLGTTQSLMENYISFSPLIVKTRIGSIYGENYEMNSFNFQFNDKEISSNIDEKFNIIVRYHLLMQNNVQIYERRYNNIIDIFSEIGGITQFIFYIFYWINYAYNQLIIDFDTNYLFFSIRDHNLKNKDNNNIKIATISNKINISGNDNRIFNIQNNIVKLSRKGTKKFRNSKFYVDKNKKNEETNNVEDYNINIKPIQVNNEDNISSENEKIVKNNNKKNLIRREKTLVSKKINEDNSKELLYNFRSKKNLKIYMNQELNDKNSKINNRTDNNNNLNLRYNNTINKSKKDLLDIDINNKFLHNKKDENKKISNQSNDRFISNIAISKKSVNQINYEKRKSISINNEINKSVNYFSFVNYVKSLFNKIDKENTQYLSLFRKHLLSEEHLLRSHINMVLLVKKYNLNENETTNVFECYNEL